MISKFDFLYSSPLFKSPNSIKCEQNFKKFIICNQGCKRELKDNSKIILSFKEQFLSGSQQKHARGGRKLNTNAKELNLFKNIKNDYILYTFYIDIPIIWQHITNGEKVLIQPHTSRKLNTNHIELKSSNPVQLPLNPIGFEPKGGHYG